MASTDDWTDLLALLLAKRRTRGDVFMDGRHNPSPDERQAARMFVEDMLGAGWVPPDEPCGSLWATIDALWCELTPAQIAQLSDDTIELAKRAHRRVWHNTVTVNGE